ncbi:choice-of-anchor D domain-containing protein [Edaphobacter sp. 12200R-103]|uniref:choice-of-anchor D domain-containing protein n=1 Tax=Edaphobacter sp. 12200R-103 TaxID=2703788 RepID=UPI00138B37E5|nr:choice-of-anchor D domain-containing protein [Edaphobacter sp. 12200R-103]QHS51260.1 choice-of-anchor D domain-containing protein [Edaphobacter sp. 12200R-103]
MLVTGRTTPQPGTSGQTANPNLTVSPASLNFPNAVVVTGTSASTLTATVTNTGAQPFPVGIGVTGDFIDSTNCNGSLAGGASCSVVVTFTPSQPGTRQGLLSVATGAASTPVCVGLTGTALPILPANNGSLDLGSTPVGQPVVEWYKIAQPLNRLTATASGDFKVLVVEDIGYGHGQAAASEFTSSSTGSCINCWVGIQFLPSTAGAYQGTLSFMSASNGAAYSVTLRGDGLPLSGLLLTPAQQDFGPVAVHSSSPASLFTLTNLTASNVTFSTPSTSEDFIIRSEVTGGSACIGSVAPGASCFVQVAFAPTATGPAAGTLTLTSDGGTAKAALTGYGSPDTGLSLNPAALVFSNVPSSSATQQTITVSNTGAYDLEIAALSSSSSAFQTGITCGTLTAGASCTVTVNFVPQSAQVSAVLSIPVTSSAPGDPQTTYTIPLSGAYTAENSGLQILPAVSDFGPTATGTSGIVRQFVVNNLTMQTVDLGLSLPRQFSLTGSTCSTLDAGRGCTFNVAFTPLTNGAVTGTIAAHATPAGGGVTLSGLGYVKGFGTGQASLTVTGDLLPGNLLAFGQVPSGQTSIQSLTLTNNGNSLITVRRITTEWPFLSTTNCGMALSPGESCTVTITYSPLDQVATGSSPAPFNTDSGTIVIESDAASSPELIPLSGTVTPQYVTVPLNAAPVYAYIVSQGSVHFDATRAGEASPAQILNLTNTGTGTIHVSGLRAPADFSVQGDCSTIVAGASCPLQLTFIPQGSPSQTASTILGALEILSNSSTSLEFVSLSGTATPSSLAISPASLNFGQVLVGSSATLQSVVTNYSSGPATIRNITANGDTAFRAIVQGREPSWLRRHHAACKSSSGPHRRVCAQALSLSPVR